MSRSTLAQQTACCEVCSGMGVFPVHADTCRNDLCSFGVGEWDCRWTMVDCDACGGTGEVPVHGQEVGR